ncbi:MAG: ABC transporter permease [Nitrospinae bacterium]|nr:ABC transporter permease [Nitrospinota bacterium]
MKAYIARRLLEAVPVVWGVVTIVFMVIHLTPGDPVEIMLGENASAAGRAALRRDLGLDRPLALQYLTFLGNVLTGDLGRSSMPSFWLGPMLIIVFSIWLGWFPVSGRGGIESLVLPAVTLGTAMAAILSRLTRSSMIEALGEDFITTARAKGAREAVILFRHALSNALLPVVTVAGLQLGGLLAGAIITETIFAWPGVGRLTIQAIQARDYPLAQGCVLAIALSYVAVNLAVDLLYAAVDPRIRRR